MTRIAAALAVLIGLASSGVAFADVIPGSYPNPAAREARETVASRLHGLGLGEGESRARASRLTDDEAAWFAARPERLQQVGQELGAPEMILGAAFLALGIFLAISLHD